MTKPHGMAPDGTPADLIGQPLHSGRGSVPGVVVRSMDTMEAAERGGVYVLNGYRYRIRKGDPLPDGAVMWGGPDHPDVIEHGIQNAGKKADEPADDTDEPKAKKGDGAPAKRSKGGAPENRAKADEAEAR